MADLITFTESPLTITDDPKTWTMSKPSSVEVGQYDALDLQLYVLGLTPTTGGIAFELTMETSMYDSDGPNWVTLDTFTEVAEAPTAERKNLPHLLRYVRWRVTKLDGASQVTFLLAGVLR